jgi:hypothetical protein
MDLDLAAGRALHTQSLYALRGGIPALYAIDRMEMDSGSGRAIPPYA